MKGLPESYGWNDISSIELDNGHIWFGIHDVLSNENKIGVAGCDERNSELAQEPELYNDIGDGYGRKLDRCDRLRQIRM